MRKTESFSRAIVGFRINIQRTRENGFKLPGIWFEKGGTSKKTEAGLPRFLLLQILLFLIQPQNENELKGKYCSQKKGSQPLASI